MKTIVEGKDSAVTISKESPIVVIGAIFGINVYIADPMKMTLYQTILAVDLNLFL